MKRAVLDAELFEMPYGVGEVVASGAAPTGRDSDNAGHLLGAEPPGIIRPVAADSEGISADPALRRFYRDRAHAVDLARHLARPDAVDRRAEPVLGEAIGDASAGAAAVEPEHQPGPLRRAAIVARIEAEAAVVAAQQRRAPVGKRHL